MHRIFFMHELANAQTAAHKKISYTRFVNFSTLKSSSNLIVRSLCTWYYTSTMDNAGQSSGQQSSSQTEEHTLVQFPNPQPASSSVTNQPMVPKPVQTVTQPPVPPSPQPIPQQTPAMNQPVPSIPILQPEEKQQEEISSAKFKESSPLPSVSKAMEWMTPTETPVNIEPAVEKVGVKEVSHAPQLTNDHKQAGLREAKEAVSAAAIASAPTSNIKLPMTKQKSQSVIKGPAFLQKASSSMVWLAYLILKNYQFLEKKEKEEKNKK